MKYILVLLFALGNIGFAKAQDELYKPVELLLVKEYNSKEEFYKENQGQFHSSISDVFLYSIKDTTYIAYWRLGHIQAFKLDESCGINSPSSIRSIEFIDNNGSNDLLAIKTYYYEAQTGSMWVQRFDHQTRLTIINLETHSIIFNDNIELNFQETEYTYEEDILQDSIPQERFNEIVENREEEVFEGQMKLDIDIDDETLNITCIHCDYEDEEFKPHLKAGEYKLVNGEYKRRAPK